MARLKVFLGGQFQAQRDLESSRELLVGRGETCDLVLNPEPGVSRQHFRVRFAEGQWLVEVLSRYGELYRNGEKQTIFGLHDGTSFTVPPYEFVFENELEGQQNTASRSAASHSQSEDDRTHIGYLPSIAFLRLTDHRGQPTQNYRLEGQAWIGGRDTGCSIFIDSPRISRKQFEIQKQDENYFIRDLGSINVTLLNGRPLSSDEWTPLSSSDAIVVGDWTLHFELRDAQFEQRLSEIDPALMMPSSYLHPGAHSDAREESENATASAQTFRATGGAGFTLPPMQKPGMVLFGRHIPGMNPVRLGLVVVILLAAIYGLTMNDGGSEKGTMAKVQTPFEKLSPEKQQVVKQLYVTAQSLLAQGRYELARQEVIKLHQIIPYYEDSKQIEDTATQGLTMLAEREKAEADERQRAITEEKIQRQVAECRAQMKPNADMAWVESCLSPVMEFNPDHPAMLALKSQVERMINERIMKEQADKEYQKKVGELRALYAKAQKIEKVATPLNAISAYDRVVGSKLPDPGGLQHKARREIASIQDSMLQKQVAAEQQADTAYHSGQLRRAIVIVREGLIINPDNEVLKGKLTQYLGELRKQMMGFYQEAIIEESLGEVESAKSRWKKIMDLSLPGEDYYEKAKMKLKKYGSL